MPAAAGTTAPARAATAPTATAARRARHRGAPRRADDDGLAALVRDGLPAAGMPGFEVPEPDLQALVAFRGRSGPAARSAPGAARVETTDGSEPSTASSSTARPRTCSCVPTTAPPPAAPDGRRATGRSRRRPTGRPTTATRRQPLQRARPDQRGERRAPRARVDVHAARHLALAGDAGRRRTGSCTSPTPTSATRSTRAPDAASGTTSGRARKGLAGDAAGGINRGVAVAGDRVFMVTDNAHLARARPLHRRAAVGHGDGRLAPELRRHVGAARGRQPGRSRASRAATKASAVFSPPSIRRPARRPGASGPCPGPASPESETWNGHGTSITAARRTWLTGTYDAGARHALLADRQPVPRLRRRRAQGDNLYSDSILALDGKTGRLKWHFQYTPHDVWDWDAQQPPVLVDATWQGQPAQAAAARQPQRVLLRARPHQRRRCCWPSRS